MCNEAVRWYPYLIVRVPDQYRTQEMCNGVVRNKLCMLGHVPDHLKTQEICNEVVRKRSYMLDDVPDHFKTQQMCIKAVKKNPRILRYAPDHFNTQKICNEVVGQQPCLFLDVPDWFVTRQVGPWHNDELIECYQGYHKRKPQKAKIEEELMPTTWHPSHWWIGVFQKNVGHKYGLFVSEWPDTNFFLINRNKKDGPFGSAFSCRIIYF